jgi:adenosylcobinamide kinase/adenosylcobinamide-phosphate guanylyltransferase
MEREKMLTFISGGARSGKSTFAEQYALQIRTETNKDHDKSLVYIATAERTDQEMEQRITRHILERSSVWYTFEVPLDIESVLLTVRDHKIILLDCLTVWLNNMLYKGQADLPRILDEVSKWIQITEQKQLHLIIVSNDVNEEIPTDSHFIHQYIYQLEKVHSLITANANSVYQVIGGIPIKWKG